MTTDQTKKVLNELLKKPENSTCADCDSSEVEYASISIGVFLCKSCAGIHRSMGSHISRIKSIKMDNWDRASVNAMGESGNLKAKSFFEKYVPAYYRRPKATDPHVLREQWIRSKYERKDFVNPSDAESSYCKAFCEGFLWKRGKEDGKFQQRKFVLTQEDNKFVLKYYNKKTEKKPKAIIDVTEINATFCPDKIHPNGMQLTYLKEGYTRSIFVYADDTKKIVDWFMSIRAAKLHRLQIAFPTTSIRDLSANLTRDFIHEGFLYKTGPRVGDAYRKRYFVLDDRKLMYLDHPLDAYPKGEIFLGEKSEGFAVRIGIPCGLKEHKFGFILLTPERTWLMGAETDDDRVSWVHAIETVIEKPTEPQDGVSGVPLRDQMRNSYSFKKSKKRVSSISHRSSSSAGSSSSIGPNGPPSEDRKMSFGTTMKFWQFMHQ